MENKVERTSFRKKNSIMEERASSLKDRAASLGD
jgi:hypothetical protein